MRTFFFAIILFLSVPVYAMNPLSWLCGLIIRKPPVPKVVRHSPTVAHKFHQVFAPKAREIVLKAQSGSLFSESNISVAFEEALDGERNPLLSTLGLQRKSTPLRESVEQAFRQALSEAMGYMGHEADTIFLISLFENRYYHPKYAPDGFWQKYPELRKILYNGNEYASFIDFSENLIENTLFALHNPEAFAALIRNLSMAAPGETQNKRRARLNAVARTSRFLDGVDRGLEDLNGMQRNHSNDANVTRAIEWVKQNLR